jgi:hypothetical protein
LFRYPDFDIISAVLLTWRSLGKGDIRLTDGLWVVMKEFLTEKEAAYSRRITELVRKMPTYVREYIDFLEESGVAFQSQKVNATWLFLYLQVFATVKGMQVEEVRADDLELVTEDILLKYIEHDGTGRVASLRNPSLAPSVNTKKSRWRAVKKFYHYLQQNGMIKNDFIREYQSKIEW